MAIAIRSKKEIALIEKSATIVAQALKLVQKHAVQGVSLIELDKIAEDYILSQNAKPAFKGLYGFPNTTCLSLNSVIIHGIPTETKLQNGDILGIDLGVECGGWFGDGAITIGIGEIDSHDEKLIACAKDVLYEAVDFCRAGLHFKELSHFLEQRIRQRGFVPLEDFCGHGIGRSPHEEPQILNYLECPNPKQGPKMREGMVFCIEPMICCAAGKPVVLEDGWSVTSQDGRNGSHYEHTVAIVNGKARILTHA